MKILKYILLSIALIGLVACGGGGTKSSDKPNEGRKTFKVDAGEDVTVEVNQTVTILGLVVSNDDVTVQSYMWTKDNEILSRKASLTYVPQKVGKDTLILTAITTDGRRATDSIDITVTKATIRNSPPKVELGDYRTVDINSSVTFTAETSDSDGKIVKYVWTNNNVVVSNSEKYIYSSTELGEVNIGLTVIDDGGAVSSDIMTVLTTKRAFITEWDSSSVVIPTSTQYKFNFTVDWGDGITDLNVTDTISHRYKHNGRHIVRITNLYPSINFGQLGDGEKIDLIAIKQWGDMELKSMKSAFLYCENLRILAKDVPNLSNVTDMSHAFRGIDMMDISSDQFNIRDWNVSNVEKMNSMFSENIVFNLDISNWDVSNVKNMSEMFYDTEASFNVGKWNVQSVENMRYMFNTFDVLSKSDYDSLLNKWAKLNLQKNVIFDIGVTHYTSKGEESRNLIISNFNWTINDAGMVD